MQLESKIQTANIMDRAYRNSTKDRFIDEYVNDLSSEQKNLIISLKNNLLNLFKKFPSMQNEKDIESNLKYIL
jgi:predicted subunit of tRNA(5-methylaminomethyl-2-thiouridylate) methyltransferase